MVLCVAGCTHFSPPGTLFKGSMGYSQVRFSQIARSCSSFPTWYQPLTRARFEYKIQCGNLESFAWDGNCLAWLWGCTRPYTHSQIFLDIHNLDIRKRSDWAVSVEQLQWLHSPCRCRVVVNVRATSHHPGLALLTINHSAPQSQETQIDLNIKMASWATHCISQFTHNESWNENCTSVINNFLNNP